MFSPGRDSTTFSRIFWFCPGFPSHVRHEISKELSWLLAILCLSQKQENFHDRRMMAHWPTRVYQCCRYRYQGDHFSKMAAPEHSAKCQGTLLSSEICPWSDPVAVIKWLYQQSQVVLNTQLRADSQILHRFNRHRSPVLMQWFWHQCNTNTIDRKEG